MDRDETVQNKERAAVHDAAVDKRMEAESFERRLSALEKEVRLLAVKLEARGRR